MEKAINILIGTFSFSAICVLPFVYVFRTGNTRRGVGIAWVMMILTMFLLSQVAFEIVGRLASYETADKYLPEGNSIVAAVGVGWIYGIIVAALAELARNIVNKITGKRKAKIKEIS